MLRGIVSDDSPASAAPVAQQLLLWISERMPRHADRVLAVAREKYARAATAVT
jgi:hypothetical protein